jgi:hypothetical protein
VDEQYRMLGREHQADLEREADRRRLAAEARGTRPGLTGRWLTWTLGWLGEKVSDTRTWRLRSRPTRASDAGVPPGPSK